MKQPKRLLESCVKGGLARTRPEASRRDGVIVNLIRE